jgi:hypothetical protein
MNVWVRHDQLYFLSFAPPLSALLNHFAAIRPPDENVFHEVSFEAERPLFASG